MFARLSIFFSTNSYGKSLLSVVSVAINLLAYLIVMRVLLINYGLDAVGFWSLVMALASIVRLLDFSGANTLNRMLPVEAHNQREQVDFIDTMSIFLILFYFSISVCVFFLFNKYLSGQNDLDNTISSQLIFGLCLLSTFLNVFSALNQSALDGLMFSQWRSYTVLAGSLIFFAVAVFLVPRFGLLGLAAAQICQHASGFVLSRLMLQRLISQLAWFPRRFVFATFVKCCRFGLLFELSGRPRLLLDPMLRLIVGNTAGLEALGLYELANKVLVQTNSLGQAIVSPRLPELADASLQAGTSLKDTYQQIARAYIPILMCMYILVLAATFGVSLILFGRVSAQYIFVSSVLLLGYGLASAGLISRLYAQAVFDFRWSIFGQAITVFVLFLALSAIPSNISIWSLAVVVSCSIFFGALIEYFGIHLRHNLPTILSHDVGKFSGLSAIIFTILVLISISFSLSFLAAGAIR